MSDDRGPDPGPLMALATSYWGAQALFTAIELDVFAALADAPLNAEDTARRISAATHSTRLLLNALTALGLLEHRNGAYEPAPSARAFLVPASQAYLGDAFAYARDMYPAWQELPRAVREDAPVVPGASYLGEDEQRTRRFVRSMHSRALGVGQALVAMVDLTGRRRMLDVGGGPGTYSALFTARYPDLRAQVLELAPVAVITEEILAEMGADDRVGVIAGSYEDTPFPESNDVVLISGVLHREREAGARALVDRAVGALAPGGLLVTSDVFTDDDGAGPEFAALFGLSMLLSASGGGVHSKADVATWLREAGLKQTEVQPFPPPMPHSVVTAVKPLL